MVMLQAFVDDSGSDPASRMFILAGFAATVPQWEHFSDEWQRVLDTEPSIAYYKNNQVYELKGSLQKKKAGLRRKETTR
jgi:hypothetical protein